MSRYPRNLSILCFIVLGKCQLKRNLPTFSSFPAPCGPSFTPKTPNFFASEMAKSLLIPAALTASASAFVAPVAQQGQLRSQGQVGTATTATTGATGATGAASVGAAGLAAAVLGGAAVAGASRGARGTQRTAKSAVVAMRAENPRVEKLRSMEKTCQVRIEI